MPKNPNVKKVLVIGSGPIVIGQAAEFDYAGTQACLALKEEGYEVILCNSNPATIMTDTDIEMSSATKQLGVIKAQSTQKFDDINGLILRIPVSYGKKALTDDDIHVVDDISVMKKRYIKFYRL